MISIEMQSDIDLSFVEMEKWKIENALAAARIEPKSDFRIRLCAQARHIVYLTHQHFVRKGSHCSNMETAASCSVSLRTVQRIIRNDSDVPQPTSCKPKRSTKSNAHRKLIDNVYLEEWVQDLI